MHMPCACFAAAVLLCFVKDRWGVLWPTIAFSSPTRETSVQGGETALSEEAKNGMTEHPGEPCSGHELGHAGGQFYYCADRVANLLREICLVPRGVVREI